MKLVYGDMKEGVSCISFQHLLLTVFTGPLIQMRTDGSAMTLQILHYLGTSGRFMSVE